MNRYSTSQLARLAAVHPNTVRLYEQWGFISSVPRKPNGYREFTGRHLHELTFARAALPGPYPCKKQLLPAAVSAYVRRDFPEAGRLIQAYAAALASEHRKALEALAILDRWHAGHTPDTVPLRMPRREAAAACGISTDALRTWERTGLLSPGKNASGRMTYSAGDLEKILVVRLLRKCGFSLASLQKVFVKGPGRVTPSEYLTRIYVNRESACESSQWMAHLDQHLARVDKLLKLLETPSSE